MSKAYGMLLSTSTLSGRLVLLQGAQAHVIRSRDFANLAADREKRNAKFSLPSFTNIHLQL